MVAAVKSFLCCNYFVPLSCRRQSPGTAEEASTERTAHYKHRSVSACALDTDRILYCSRAICWWSYNQRWRNTTSYSRNKAFCVKGRQTSWKKDGKYFCVCARFNTAYTPTTWPQGAHVEFKPRGTADSFTACAVAPFSQDTFSALTVSNWEIELCWFVFLINWSVVQVLW